MPSICKLFTLLLLVAVILVAIGIMMILIGQPPAAVFNIIADMVLGASILAAAIAAATKK